MTMCNIVFGSRNHWTMHRQSVRHRKKGMKRTHSKKTNNWIWSKRKCKKIKLLFFFSIWQHSQSQMHAICLFIIFVYRVVLLLIFFLRLILFVVVVVVVSYVSLFLFLFSFSVNKFNEIKPSRAEPTTILHENHAVNKHAQKNPLSLFFFAFFYNSTALLYVQFYFYFRGKFCFALKRIKTEKIIDNCLYAVYAKIYCHLIEQMKEKKKIRIKK